MSIETSNLLIVEDDLPTRAILKILLSSEKYRVTMVGSFEDAIAALEKIVFSVVISDVNIGEPGGVALIPHVKKACPSCEIIFLTGMAAGQIHETSELSDVEWIAKPFDLFEMQAGLIDAVERAIKRSRQNVD